MLATTIGITYLLIKVSTSGSCQRWLVNHLIMLYISSQWQLALLALVASSYHHRENIVQSMIRKYTSYLWQQCQLPLIATSILYQWQLPVLLKVSKHFSINRSGRKKVKFSILLTKIMSYALLHRGYELEFLFTVYKKQAEKHIN